MSRVDFPRPVCRRVVVPGLEEGGKKKKKESDVPASATVMFLVFFLWRERKKERKADYVDFGLGNFPLLPPPITVVPRRHERTKKS